MIILSLFVVRQVSFCKRRAAGMKGKNLFPTEDFYRVKGLANGKRHRRVIRRNVGTLCKLRPGGGWQRASCIISGAKVSRQCGFAREDHPWMFRHGAIFKKLTRFLWFKQEYK